MMRKFSVEFTAKNLTGNAGLVHLMLPIIKGNVKD